MNQKKCAFGATVVNQSWIYVCGGYDGQKRIDSIEKYSPIQNKWTLLQVNLTQALSNLAAFSYLENTLLIVGGGSESGFSLDINLLDLQTQQWKTIAKLPDGKDLRNKLILSSNFEIYIIGGNEEKGCKLNILSEKLTEISTYSDFVKDNLDSWVCFTTTQHPDKKLLKSKMNQKKLKLKNNLIQFTIDDRLSSYNSSNSSFSQNMNSQTLNLYPNELIQPQQTFPMFLNDDEDFLGFDFQQQRISDEFQNQNQMNLLVNDFIDGHNMFLLNDEN